MRTATVSPARRSTVVRFLGENLNGWLPGNFVALHEIAERVLAGEPDPVLTPNDDRYDEEDIDIARQAFHSAVGGEFLVDDVRFGTDRWESPIYLDSETLGDYGITVEDVAAVLEGDPLATAQAFLDAYTALRNGERGRAPEDVADAAPVDPAIVAYADKIKAMIREDVASGQVPASVTTFEELHEHVDANEYLIDADVPWEEGPDGLTDLGPTNAVTDVVHQWLQAGGLQDMLGTCSNPDHDHDTPIDRHGRDFTGKSFVMRCNDCGQPTHYDRGVEDYRHDDPAAPGCFLIPTREGDTATPCKIEG